MIRPRNPLFPRLTRAADHRAVHDRRVRGPDARRWRPRAPRAASRSGRGWRTCWAATLGPGHRAARRLRHRRPEGADRPAGDLHHAALRPHPQHDLVQRVARERPAGPAVQDDRRAGQRPQAGQRRAAHLQRRRLLALADRLDLLQPPGAVGRLPAHLAALAALDAAARRQLPARARQRASTAPACRSRRRSAARATCRSRPSSTGKRTAGSRARTSTTATSWASATRSGPPTTRTSAGEPRRVSILAFPSQAANFGIGQSASLGSIIPQNFANLVNFGGRALERARRGTRAA